MTEVQKESYPQRTPEHIQEPIAENVRETTRRTQETAEEREQKHETVSTATQVAAAQQTPARTIDPEQHAIESILAENLEDFFVHLSPAKQLEFKRAGEAAAVKIVAALRTKRTRIKDIVRLIIDWLKALPGLNRFFLEQEAKIKADTIYGRYRKQ